METTIEITSMAHGGDGIGRIEGQVCFVRHGVPGDVLRVQLSRKTPKALWAEIVGVESPSPDRIAAECPVFGQCGGCSWLHFAYPAQAEWKRRIVQDALQRIGGVETTLDWTEAPELRRGYRTRAEFHGDGTRLGFYAAASHAIVDIPSCPLCHPRMNEALLVLREADIKGSVTVTVNPEGEEVLVWTRFPKRSLKHRFPLANTPQDTMRARFLFDGVPVVNGAFSQASLLLNRLLARIVREYASNASSLLDLYCGSGNLSLGLADHMRVLGLDHHRDAVRAADSIQRGAYQSGDEAKMAKHIRSGEWDTILLDPPREGAKALMSALAACSARAILYVSCDPATLARDVKMLRAGGWKLSRGVVIDLFPNTPHVETVCRLER